MRDNLERYKIVYKKGHPNSSANGRIREHVYIASLAFGKALPKGVQVHHVDENPKNNTNANLVICTNSYHRLLHARTDAYMHTGDANKMKCAYCGLYDDPQNMYKRPNQYQAWHLDCRKTARRVSNPKTGPYKYAR